MKKILQLLKRNQTKLVLGGGLALASPFAFALPAAVATGFTTLLTDVQDLINLAWTVVVPITIAFIILRMFKKAAASAT